MHDLLDNSENAAASQDRVGLSRGRGRIAFPATPHPARPALHAAGAFAFLRPHPAAAHSGEPPLATTPRRPGHPAGLRIVET
jgi:hypothetical protein